MDKKERRELMEYFTDLALMVLFIVAFAWHAGPNTAVNTPDAVGNIAGFWSGLCHGLTLGFSFLHSIFQPDSTSLFAVHNNGGGYNFGFISGIAALLVIVKVRKSR